MKLKLNYGLLDINWNINFQELWRVNLKDLKNYWDFD